MMKNKRWIQKSIYGLLMGVCLLSVGCGKEGKGTDDANTKKTVEETTGVENSDTMKAYSFDNIGIMMDAPEVYVNQNVLSLDVYEESPDEMAFIVSYYSPEYWTLMEETGTKSLYEASESELQLFQEKAAQLSAELFTIIRCKESQKAATQEQLAQKGTVTEIGRQEGFVYLGVVQASALQNLSVTSTEAYEACKTLLPKMQKSVKLIPIVIPEKLSQNIPAFHSKDLMGNAVNNDIFKDHKVTMINFWGTFCGPCIVEMPELAMLAKEMPEGTQLIGVVTDVKINSDENVQLAKDILEKAGATFPNIQLDDGWEQYTSKLIGVPTTIFVDDQGQLLGEPIIGSQSKEAYRAALEEFLK